MGDLEKSILKDFHDFHLGKRSKPIHTEYNLKHKGSKRAPHEFAHYLLKLKKEGFLDFEDSKVIHPGGIRDEEYNNSVAMVFTDNIEVTDKTMKLFKPKVEKVGGILKDQSKDFGKTVNNEVKGYFAKAVAGIIILGILLIILKVLDLF